MFIQVGPSIEVLGDKAIQNGLSVSLLERLHSKHENLPIVTIATNFRCHPHILDVAGNLFYSASLKLPPANMYQPVYSWDLPCFKFTCYSIDDSIQEVVETINEEEVSVILNELKTLTDFRYWPKEYGWCDVSRICIISPSRRQVIKILLPQHYVKDLILTPCR